MLSHVIPNMPIESGRLNGLGMGMRLGGACCTAGIGKGEGTMALFTSTVVNRIDKKGRLSVPALFRSELAADEDQTLIVFRSLNADALECCGRSYMRAFNEKLEQSDLPPEQKDMLAMAVFGSSVTLTLDAEGRIALPENMIEFAHLGESAAFVGAGATFQIWEPTALAAQAEAARAAARAQGFSLRSISVTPRSPQGSAL